MADPKINVIQKKTAAADRGGGDEVVKKRSIPIWVIVVIASHLIIFGAGIFIAKTIYEKSVREREEKIAAAQEAEEALRTKKDIQYPLPPFEITLTSDGDKIQHLDIKLIFEIETQFSKNEVEAKLALLRDELTMLMSMKKAKEINNPEGRNKLQQELLTRTNRVLVEGQVKQIYFADFLIH